MVLATALSTLHGTSAWVAVLGNGAAGLWALGAHRYEALRSKALWWFTAVAEVAILVTVILGVALQNSEDIEPADLHNFYGFVALIAVGLIYSYNNQIAARYRCLLYGGSGLFLMGMGIRTMLLKN